MIPRRLRLHNFLSYRDCELSLAGVHTAVLSGKNGEGKSALLDAMTWALWGKCRGDSEEDRIHLNAGEMSVEFEFDAHGDRYLVIRKRTRGRSSGALDWFHLNPDGGRTTLSGGVLRETQADIIKRLRMTYDTFVHSAFIAQGRSNEFTRKTPGDRKEVFRGVLGLERYESLSDASKDRQKEAKITADGLDRSIGAAQNEVARLPEVECELESVMRDLCAVLLLIEPAEVEVGELKVAAASYQALIEAQRDAERRRNTLWIRRDECERDRAKSAADFAALEARLARRDEIAQRYSELVAARDEDHRLGALQSRGQALSDCIAKAERAIGEEQARLESSQQSLRTNVNAGRALVAELPRLLALAGQLEQRRAGLGVLEMRASEAAKVAGEARERVASSLADAKNARERAAELKEKGSQLVGGAPCPVCRRPLTPGQLDQALADYAAERKQLGEVFREANDIAERATELVTSLEAECQRLLAERKAGEASLAIEERAAHNRLHAAQEAEKALAAHEPELLEIEARLSRGDFEPEARRILAVSREHVASLGYDAVAHTALRERLRELAPVDREHKDLAVLEERAAGLQAAIARMADEFAAVEAELREAEAAMKVTAQAVDAATDVTPRLQLAEAKLHEYRERLADLMTRKGRAESERDHLGRLRATIETGLEQLRAYREEEEVYGQLRNAFGKDGIQAMLIDQALPRLEQVANDMLDHMTGGRITVAIRTQKTIKSGAARETLDIEISDELGTRPYEMYSGGEAFRVDFALRIALSRLLAERSGAEMPTLIIDEGFGTQDSEGIDRLMEALEAIRDEFRLILVVTHIDELKERFERRIDVTKDPVKGSFATIV